MKTLLVHHYEVRKAFLDIGLLDLILPRLRIS